MKVELVPAKPEHLPELAQICHLAFNTLHERHRVPPDVPSLEVGQMIIGGIIQRPDYVGVAALVEGKIVGSNFLCTADEVCGVGPITVDPETQAQGVGRLLMQWAIDEARRAGRPHVRLFQEAINTTSLSLYSKLGFEWRLSAALMSPKAADADDPSIRPMTLDDLQHVARLSTQQYGFTRAGDVEQLLKMGLPAFVRSRDGHVVGYQIATLFGHACAETPADLLALVAHVARKVPPPMAVFICPLVEHELFAKALAAGHRLLKVLNYMSLPAYKTPEGNWLPSIQC